MEGGQFGTSQGHDSKVATFFLQDKRHAHMTHPSIAIMAKEG